MTVRELTFCRVPAERSRRSLPNLLRDGFTLPAEIRVRHRLSNIDFRGWTDAAETGLRNCESAGKSPFRWGADLFERCGMPYRGHRSHQGSWKATESGGSLASLIATSSSSETLPNARFEPAEANAAQSCKSHHVKNQCRIISQSDPAKRSR
jgi:hypothetical protein